MASKRKNTRMTPSHRGITVVAPEGANVDPLVQNTAATVSAQSNGIHLGVSPVTYSTLFAMARTPVTAAIISTRQNQVADFASRLRTQHMNGWSIQLRKPHAIPSRTDRYMMEHIAAIIDTAGGDWQPGGFGPWLFRIAMNRLRDEMRRRKRQARSMDMTGGRSDENGQWAAVEDKITLRRPADAAPAEEASKGEQIERLREAVGRLNEADQQILYLRHTAGLSFAQIADTLNEPLGTVLARGHRALNKLRKILGDDSSEK